MDYNTFLEELTETRDIIEQLHYHISTNLQKGLYDNPDEIRNVRSTMRLAEGRLRAMSEALRVETSVER